MKKRAVWTGIAGAALLLSASGVSAAPLLRTQVTQRGDFILIGNTLGQECAAGTPLPIVGSVGNCGLSTADTSADVSWRSDEPGPGTALADTSITVAQARSTAVLTLPSGATVTSAYLYYSGRIAAAQPDLTVTLERPGVFLENLTATDSALVADVGNFYQSVVDVTALVQTHGSGAYRVSGVESIPLSNVNQAVLSTGWFMVVIYGRPQDPPRNIALFDGLDTVIDGAPQTATLSGFIVPNAGFDAKLAVVAYDGDNQSVGDQLLWDGTPLADAVNPADNFFNSSRSFLGAPVSVPGDLPQLTGTPQSMSGIDFDTVNITSLLSTGQTSAVIEATTTGDVYVLGGFITSISALKPDLSSSNKTVTDLNGGTLTPGDELEYAIEVANTGDDASLNTVLSDALPPQVTFIPGSIKVIAGPNAGGKTDQAQDDQAEFDAASSTVIARLGTGADAAKGGSLNVGESTTLVFRVTVNADADGTISNQATITASGQQGAPEAVFPTDGNGGNPGSPPTEVIVDSDGDGLSDGTETAAGTNPFDADSDDDGVIDGQEPSWNLDSDGDGLINALDPDSDNDGLFDGTELGKDCSNPATDTTKDRCIPDGDGGATTTSPLNPDTDGGGVNDGSEDADRDGVVDPGELDPTEGHAADDAMSVDSDADGLSDSLEVELGTNPNDADTDDDGVLDGAEPNPTDDTDGDGLINPLDSDSDNDGLFDGTELGLDCMHPATNTANGQCTPDGDGGATTTSPIDPDTDDGGVNDGSEDADRDGVVDPGETDPTPGHGDDDATNPDSDGDGLSDALEEAIGSNPNDADSDDDGIPDGLEPNPAADSDGDGVINVLDPDSDNDGLFDGTEAGYGCAGPGTDASANHCVPDADGGATTTSPINPDTDGGGVSDGSEDTNLNGKIDAGELDPNNPSDDTTAVDSDGDGLSDKLEAELGTNPNDADSDDDGVPDGQEPNPSLDSDGDGLINALDPDSDNDGLYDGTELGLGCSGAGTNTGAGHCVPDADGGETKTSPINPDTDGGGASDGSEDANLDGKVDPGETDPTAGHGGDDFQNTDSDGDGLGDKLEEELGLNPNDADSDDDGVLDGDEPNPTDDADGDGLINALDPDSDNDGLFDGTELGLGCANPATDKSKGHCIPDGDNGATTTSPIDADTDDGGISDGSEDVDRDGVVDPGETDPNNGADDKGTVDSDGDGLSDKLEKELGSNPNDADTDDDGVIDGLEANPADDTDGDGLINVLDADSDNDGLFDGTELGLGCENPATDPATKSCVPDADMGKTTTSPIDPDTDGGGVSDGSEDWNLNGAIDAGETDPTAGHGDDDHSNADDDMDGLSNSLETKLGTDPNDADSDDDGVLDGMEPNPSGDTDGDGKLNPLDSDSDNDGLFDGTELGLGCSHPDTNADAMSCIQDADAGATTTSPLDPDTDNGGVSDGDEDSNKDGQVDMGERDPNDPSDDMPGTSSGSGGSSGGWFDVFDPSSCACEAAGAGGARDDLGWAISALGLLVLTRRRGRRSAA
ncbi:MAG TPA: DUF3344 domain-containing protein [Polyangiaceae bacterium]|nr:DUF3344 domain-containing protein [Polyangiaceae bacterium]